MVAVLVVETKLAAGAPIMGSSISQLSNQLINL